MKIQAALGACVSAVCSLLQSTQFISVSNTRSVMAFHWVGPNAVEDGEAGSMALSPVLKNHNAYLIHNETLYCEPGEEWRGEVEAKLSDVERAGSFALFHLF